MFVKNAIFISLTHVHVSLARIYILFYSLLAIEPRIYIICADSMDYTSKLGVCVCYDPLYYSDSRRAIHILNIFSSSICFYYYNNIGVYVLIYIYLFITLRTVVLFSLSIYISSVTIKYV